MDEDGGTGDGGRGSIEEKEHKVDVEREEGRKERIGRINKKGESRQWWDFVGLRWKEY